MYNWIRNAATVIFGLNKTHQYPSGQRFKIFTDHKPPLDLFQANKRVSVLPSPRIQRWAFLLAACDYEMIYREGHNKGNADGLSWLPLPDTVSKVPTPGETSLLMHLLEATPVRADNIAEWTGFDPVLKQVLRKVQHSWSPLM